MGLVRARASRENWREMQIGPNGLGDGRPRGLRTRLPEEVGEHRRQAALGDLAAKLATSGVMPGISEITMTGRPSPMR